MAISPTDRLLRATRRRLFVVTLTLLTLLVVGVGAATAVMGLNALDADVDQALRAAVDATTTSLSGELPASDEGQEPDEQQPAAADTVLLVLDKDGAVVQNRTGSALPGLPDADALAGATTAGTDLRTIRAGSHSLRLLTVPLTHDGALVGFVQGGFILDLHDSQSDSLVLAVITVGAMGLVAAALITLLVTGRALVPIRNGFEAQRRFVADASHELRTPAALIRANAEVLERERLVAADGAPLLSDVIAEADRLGGLVGELLQLAAWDETRTTLSPVSLDLAALAAEVVRGASALAAERGVRLELEAPRTGARDRRPGTARPAAADPDRQRDRSFSGRPRRRRPRHRRRPQRGHRGHGRRPRHSPGRAGADLRAVQAPDGHDPPRLGRHGSRPRDRTPDRGRPRRVDPCLVTSGWRCPVHRRAAG